MYSVKHNNVFIELMATTFGCHDRHQISAIQNFKKTV
jgi:hypothetical protein